MMLQIDDKQMAVVLHGQITHPLILSSNLNKPKKNIKIIPNEKLKKNYLQARCDILFYNPPDCSMDS